MKNLLTLILVLLFMVSCFPYEQTRKLEDEIDINIIKEYPVKCGKFVDITEFSKTDVLHILLENGNLTLWEVKKDTMFCRANFGRVLCREDRGVFSFYRYYFNLPY
jgi:hypothetical protein